MFGSVVRYGAAALIGAAAASCLFLFLVPKTQLVGSEDRRKGGAVGTEVAARLDEMAAELGAVQERLGETEARLLASQGRVRKLSGGVVGEGEPPKEAGTKPLEGSEKSGQSGNPDLEKQTAALTVARAQEQFEALGRFGLHAFGRKEMGRLVKLLRGLDAEGVSLAGRWMLESESANERFIAAALLEGLGDERAVTDLQQALARDDSLLVRRMAAHALAVGGYEAGADALRRAVEEDEDWGVRANSLYGLGKQGDELAVDRLIELYDSPELPGQYRLGLLGGLGDIASPRSAPLIHRILGKSHDIAELSIVIRAVGKMSDSSFLPDLTAVIANEELDATVREQARNSYNEIVGYEAYGK